MFVNNRVSGRASDIRTSGFGARTTSCLSAMLLGALLATAPAQAAGTIAFHTGPFDIPDDQSDLLVPFAVSGVADATTVEIGLNGVSHTYPDDLIFGLVNETAGRGMIFYSDVGGWYPVEDQSWIFSDTALVQAPRTDYVDPQGPMASGSYLPSDFADWPLFSVPGTSTLIEKVDSFTALLSGADDGVWYLFAHDRFPAFGDFGDHGGVYGGATLTFTLSGETPVIPDPTDPTDPTPVDPIPGVPEPGTWALMIAGFGLVGMLRRRRTLLTARG